jgi:urease accessory protein UreH
MRGHLNTWASVIYNITKDVKYVTTSGGWASGSSVPVDVYVQSRAKTDVIKADVEKVEKEKEKEAPAAMGAVELKKLEDTQKLLIDQLNAMAKKIEELEGKKK